MECPECGGEMTLTQYDGGDPPVDEPSAYYSCEDCGYVPDDEE